MKEENYNEFGGNCIIPNVQNSRRKDDYDIFNDYQSIQTNNKNY